MTLIDQFVGEIIIEGNCKLYDLEKDGINRFQTFNELNYYSDYILNCGCPDKCKVK